MHLTVTARHFKLTDDLNSFIEKEVPIFKRHYDGILDVEVILGWEKKDRICEINVNIEGRTLTASDRSEDMKKSIRLCVEKMDRQLRKQNRRQHESTHKPAGENKTAV